MIKMGRWELLTMVFVFFLAGMGIGYRSDRKVQAESAQRIIFPAEKVPTQGNSDVYHWSCPANTVAVERWNEQGTIIDPNPAHQPSNMQWIPPSEPVCISK
jgi:cbb3-type cytochrome oxidase subunit 3